MSSTIATVIRTRSNQMPVDPTRPEGNLDEIIKWGRVEPAAAQKPQGPSREPTGNKEPNVESKSPLDTIKNKIVIK